MSPFDQTDFDVAAVSARAVPRDTYDEQIELLLAGRFAEWSRLVGLLGDPPDSISVAWGLSGYLKNSLFRMLPGTSDANDGCGFCATIAHGFREHPVAKAVLTDSEAILSPIGWTRANLQEVARRQRVARAELAKSHA